MPDSPATPHQDDRAQSDSTALLAGTGLVIAAAFLFRFLTVDFTNDHFVHLSRAAQILLGDVPLRDFFDPGLILQYYASAAALAWSGHNLFGEALLTCGFIAVGAGLTFFMSMRLSKSVWIAAAATLLAFMSLPRLYNYPKTFLYVLALTIAWRYAQRQSRGNMVVLAGTTALAFLFRHDHGVYIAFSLTAFMALLHWPEWRRAGTALTVCGALTLAFLAPFFVFVQSTTGLARYVMGIAPQIEGVATVRVNRLPFVFDASAPLWVVTPTREQRINIRWMADLDDATRRDRERTYGLTESEQSEGSTWSYVPVDQTHDNITALITDPAVDDTSGIDRSSGVVDLGEPFYRRVERALPVFRAQLAPGVFSETNARAWFYYTTFLVPLMGLVTLGALLWRGHIPKQESAVIGMAVLLSLIIVQTLVRGSPDSRLPDVAGPVCIVAAWLGSVWLRTPGSQRARRRAWRTVAALAIFIISAWSVGTDAHVKERLVTSGILSGPAGIWDRLGSLHARLRDRPIESYAPGDPGVPGLARYVFTCTQDTDRVLVTWFQPEIFFYAERGFAGGQVYLHQNWHASSADQALTIERLERQRVPVVLAREPLEYRVRFPLVYDYVQEHYVEAPMASEAMRAYRVFVNRRLTPTGTYEPLGLPCYR
jgi:hypothetical protein